MDLHTLNKFLTIKDKHILLYEHNAFTSHLMLDSDEVYTTATVHPLTELRYTVSAAVPFRFPHFILQFDFMLLLYAYQMIFSVNQQFTCCSKCELLVHILASEAISARGEK